MNFFSLEFILLFASSLALVWLAGAFTGRLFSEKAGQQARNCVLIAASLVFIGWVDIMACIIVVLTAVMALVVTAEPVRQRFGKGAQTAGIVLALGALAAFKYFDFFIDSFCSVFGLDDPGTLVLYVPLGISYFSFSVISFICDSYAGKMPQKAGLPDMILYMVFFPKFLAGPIVKAADFWEQLQQNHQLSLRRLERGIQIFLLGMFKKNVIADHLSVFVNDVFAAPAAYNTATIWLAVISYTLQLYFDFSGYSDMAIGCAAMLGFDFKRNFNMPFAAGSIQEFWRRWHISLSTWFRDYLYIPLGGNRKGKMRTGINKSIVFLLTGLWHGASWTFVVWGMIHGVFMLLETYVISPSKWRIKPLRHIYTMFVVVFAFMIFRAPDMDTALAMAKGMFLPQEGIFQPYLWTFAAIMLLASAIVVIYLRGRSRGGVQGGREMAAFYPCLDLGKFGNLVIFWTVVIFILMLAYTGSSPFVYAQF